MRVKRTIKGIGKITLWLLGIWAGLLILIQIVLSPAVMTKIINRLSSEYIDADVNFGKASVSIFRHFPRVTLSLEDVEITYPHDRFDSLEQRSMQGILLYSGCGETADTLASIQRLSASLSLSSLMTGSIRIPHLEIDRPKIFAHYYDEHHANWNIWKSDASAEEETDSLKLEDTSDDGMNIVFRKISLSGDPTIVYTDSKDSLFTLITMNEMAFDGNFETNAILKTMANAHIENLFLAGRHGADTLAVRLDRLNVEDAGQHMHIDIRANTFLASEMHDRIIVPIDFSTDLSFNDDSGLAITLDAIKSEIATIPASGHLSVKMTDDRTSMNGKIDIDRFKVQVLLHAYMAKYLPELANVRTGSVISANATINGHFDSYGTTPDININIEMPESDIDYSTFPEKIHMGMTACFQMDTTGRMRADITKGGISTSGLKIDVKGGIEDITGEDPQIKINGDMMASLDALRKFLPDTMNIITEGSLTAKLNGTLKSSDIGMYRFSNADLTGEVNGDGIKISMPDDTIDLKIDGLDVRLAPDYVTSKRDPSKSFRLMGITGDLTKADITFKNAFSFKGQNINFSAKNSTDNADEAKKGVAYLGGRFNADLLQLDDSQGNSIKFEKTLNSFQMRPKRGQSNVPVLSVSNRNLRITYVTDDNRAILTDSQISAEAAMNTFDRLQRRNAYLDSLAKAHPDIPRDSLYGFMRSRRAVKRIPSWMTEEDFQSSDIRIDLNETFRKYYREWDLKGNAAIRTGIIMTPYFPLRNILRGASMSITNNMISIDSLKMMAGDSEICMKGSVSGLRRAMLGNGGIQMDLKLSSGSVNADEMLKAYSIGSQFEAENTTSAGNMTNAEFFKQVTTDTVLAVPAAPELFVIPGNIYADIDITASGIKYKDLSISSFNADMLIKERCAQLTNTSMRSNMGGFDLDAFYATRSKKDIQIGLCLDIKDVTSERVINLVPQIGKIMPMIGSINGMLNCEFAATASLDTTMSIQMNTVNGIARLSGRNLSISDDEFYTEIARKLMFKNKKKGEIDQLQVEGSIKDNSLEVFPFILDIDRYTLAVSGRQNMDMSYRHHVSVLRSPLLIRLGLNISGPDYDHMKFKVGKALYRVNKMPSFTAVIDQTKNDLRYSIYNIFETGIDKTIENRDMQSLILRHQNDIGYINAAELKMEELSETELEKLEDSEKADSILEEAMAAAASAVQEALKNK